MGTVAEVAFDIVASEVTYVNVDVPHEPCAPVCVLL